LGLEHYVQITSPLRRYLDLTAHQQIRNHLEGNALLSVQEIIERIGAIEALGNLRQAERLSNKHWTLVYLLQNPNWEGEGVLVEKQGRRAMVLIPELDLEIRPRLPGDIPLNSHIRLRNPKVNLPELEVHFATEI
ncbi:MAG TPA: RNB domain-containing ribonuclease, partial [Anaerolineae bacterium]|nr:RNB domain-containing ribonuclease [Anaerolineae bacterium]